MAATFWTTRFLAASVAAVGFGLPSLAGAQVLVDNGQVNVINDSSQTLSFIVRNAPDGTPTVLRLVDGARVGYVQVLGTSRVEVGDAFVRGPIAVGEGGQLEFDGGQAEFPIEVRGNGRVRALAGRIGFLASEPKGGFVAADNARAINSGAVIVGSFGAVGNALACLAGGAVVMDLVDSTGSLVIVGPSFRHKGQPLPSGPLDVLPRAGTDLVLGPLASGGVLANRVANGTILAPVVDSDGDGWPDACDNCPSVANPWQEDRGRLGAGSVPDGIGDACQCGDVNDDGAVTLSDAVAVQRSLLNPPTATLAAPERCDVGGARGCSIGDAVQIRRALLIPPAATVQQACAPAAP